MGRERVRLSATCRVANACVSSPATGREWDFLATTAAVDLFVVELLCTEYPLLVLAYRGLLHPRGVGSAAWRRRPSLRAPPGRVAVVRIRIRGRVQRSAGGPGATSVARIRIRIPHLLPIPIPIPIRVFAQRNACSWRAGGSAARAPPARGSFSCGSSQTQPRG